MAGLRMALGMSKFCPHFSKKCLCISLFLLNIIAFGPVQGQSAVSPDNQRAQLQGKVEEEGALEQDKNIDLNSDNGMKAKPTKDGYLEGRAQLGELDAAKEDPDADDKELMIAWDRWRNRFLQAVLESTSEMLNSDQARSFQIDPNTHIMEPKYPVGTVAWFVCEVTRNREIKHLKILNSSGYANYDQAVLDAVQALQGSSLLKFPSGSRRVAVLQGGAVERSTQEQKQYFRFGDVERYRVPAD